MAALGFKSDVALYDLPVGGLEILAKLAEAALYFDLDLTITSGREAHPPTDPHTRGLAFDVRTSNLSPGQTVAVYQWLKVHLGPDFTVLYEVPTAPAPNTVLADIATINAGASAAHLHVQLKKGLATWDLPATRASA